LRIFIESYFKRRSWTVKRAVGHVPAYDMCITKGPASIYVECKYDLMSDRTGNYALEKASLEHTQNQVLIFGTTAECYALPMETARRFFNRLSQKADRRFSQTTIQHSFPRLSLSHLISNDSENPPAHKVKKGCLEGI
jgi:hypothetical protein